MKYLLDTCVISDFVKGNKKTLQKIKSLLPSDLAVSSVTIMELKYGLQLNPQRAKKIAPIVNSLINNITILPYITDSADKTAYIRAELKIQGTPIGPYDIMIAGTALEHNLIMVTANTKEFNRIEQLIIENWQ